MQSNTNLTVIPKELKTLTENLQKQENVSIYDTSNKIVSIVEQYPQIENLILSSKSDEIEEEIQKLKKLNEDASNNLLDFFEILRKEIRPSRELYLKIDNILNYINLVPKTDVFFSYDLSIKLKEFVEFSIEQELWKEDDKHFFDYISGSMDPMLEEEISDYKFNWKEVTVRNYLNLLNNINRTESSKAWYNYRCVKSLSLLWRAERCDIEYPISYYNYLTTKAELLSYNENFDLSVPMYSTDSIKSSWNIVFSFLEKHNKLNENDFIILFDKGSGKFVLPDGKTGFMSKDKPDYKILLAFVSGESFVNFEDIIETNDSTFRSEITGDLRKKLKLDKDQLINKDGYLSLSGVHILENN